MTSAQIYKIFIFDDDYEANIANIFLRFLAHLWCAYAIPLALSVVCVVSSNLTAADMKEII